MHNHKLRKMLIETIWVAKFDTIHQHDMNPIRFS